MKSMTKIQNLKPLSKEKGFTIIELVVVILLLGILTATALPRFMDVTSQARTAVLQATAGGLTTGAALYRAQWFAEGAATSGTPAGFGGLVATSGGYPAISNGCATIYTNLLQPGAPTVSGASESGVLCVLPLIDANNVSLGTVNYNTTTGVGSAQ